MAFLKSDLFRSFGVGFVLGCFVLLATLGTVERKGAMVPSAVAATSK